MSFVKKIILPMQNLKDLFEVSEDVKNDIEFYPVECMAEAIQLVFELELEKLYINKTKESTVNQVVFH